MIWAYVTVAISAQALDAASWAVMPVGRVAEGNFIVLWLGPTLALTFKVAAVTTAAVAMGIAWRKYPVAVRFVSSIAVFAGVAGTLSNLPR